MSFEGRWILGTSGSERLGDLRGQLDSRDIREACGAVASGQVFQPWMSARQLRSEQDARPFPILRRVLNHRPHIVLAAQELDGLSSYFTRSGKLGLQLLGSDDDSRLQVESPLDPWLETTKILAPKAIDTIMGTAPTWNLRFSSLCQLIIPLGLSQELPERRDVGRGFSSHLFRGAMFLDPPATPEYRFEAYCINLVHELGHQALIVYQSADAIIDGPLDAPVYSVIRKTDRPAIQSYHAVVAAAYMAEFIGDWLQADPAAARCSYLKTRLAENIDHIENGIKALSGLKYTDVGRQILDEMLDLAAYLRGVHGI